jgi:hypothetical protein
MELYTGAYYYSPLRKGERRLYRNDGTYPPADAPEDTLFITGSTSNYHMETTGDIRVLTLLPGSFRDPIQCRLTVKRIEEQPQYDALSYMWGDPLAAQWCTLDSDEQFPITVSLDLALRHVRLQDDVRHLWVDAICINQSDIKERNNQVSLMKEIYSGAQTVRVWIDITLTHNTPCVRKLMNCRRDTPLDYLGDEPKFWEPLIPLFQNPYWDKLWVQQELVFASNLVFCTRGVTIPGDSLINFQLLVARKASRSRGTFDTVDAWSMFGKRLSTDKTFSRSLAYWREMLKYKVPVDPYTLKPDYSYRLPSAEWQRHPRKFGTVFSTCPIYLLGMLRYAQTLEVSDPRDRINATLNLAIDYDDDGMTMDYETSLTDIYTRVARLLPFKCNSLQFLAQARFSLKPDPRVKGLPSWAPNWNAPGNAGYFLAPFRAAGDLPMYSWPF